MAHHSTKCAVRVGDPTRADPGKLPAGRPAVGNIRAFRVCGQTSLGTVRRDAPTRGTDPNARHPTGYLVAGRGGRIHIFELAGAQFRSVGVLYNYTVELREVAQRRSLSALKLGGILVEEVYYCSVIE